MMRVVGLIALAWGVSVVCTFAGARIGTHQAELGIAQDCAADGYFVIERDGTPWVYACSMPKLHGGE